MPAFGSKTTLPDNLLSINYLQEFTPEHIIVYHVSSCYFSACFQQAQPKLLLEKFKQKFLANSQNGPSSFGSDNNAKA